MIASTVILVLAGIGYSAVKSCIRSARKTEELAALRRVTQAYLLATQENGGRFPLGLDQYSNIHDLDLRLPDDTSLLSKIGGVEIVIRRLPLRLVPYLGWDAEHGFVTWANKATFRAGVAGVKGSPGYYYGLSISPAFGLNAYCVGGYGGGYLGGGERVADLAVRPTEVASPGKLIAFASSNTFYVKPPRMQMTPFDKVNPGWTEQSDKERPGPEDAARYGNLRFSYDGNALVSFLDGHSEVKSSVELRDARLWSRAAQAEDDPARSVQR
ncbi:MAG TPA: hypothetical protein VNQ90_19595 [Chthoniobacteraceae bacterium]|nr:hypothetical protein [Chthoniobacteraceae bacterium]